MRGITPVAFNTCPFVSTRIDRLSTPIGLTIGVRFGRRRRLVGRGLEICISMPITYLYSRSLNRAGLARRDFTLGFGTK